LYVFLHSVAVVAHDDDETLGAELLRGGQRVTEHGAAAKGMQHLGGLGLHPRALARGEDDDCGRAAYAHSEGLLGIAADT
jgi:hypothetical protein